jgi:hypothetical protein
MVNGAMAISASRLTSSPIIPTQKGSFITGKICLVRFIFWQFGFFLQRESKNMYIILFCKVEDFVEFICISFICTSNNHFKS